MRQEKVTGARRQGKKYEAAALEHLEQRYKEYFVPAPWLQYLEQNGAAIQWCQPDGLLINPRSGRIVIIEIKLKHTAEAYYQLKYLYLPVLKQIFGDKHWTYSLVEFVKWYDISIPFPEPVAMREDIRDARPGVVQVTIWKP